MHVCIYMGQACMVLSGVQGRLFVLKEHIYSK